MGIFNFLYLFSFICPLFLALQADVAQKDLPRCPSPNCSDINIKSICAHDIATQCLSTTNAQSGFWHVSIN